MAKNMPVGVKILSVLFYIGVILSIIGAIAMFFGGAALSLIPEMALFGEGLMVVGGIFMLVLAVLYFFIGRGLWKGQNWARIVTIILAALGFIGALSSITTSIGNSIINLIVNGVIIWYLGFSKGAKQAFK